MRIVADFRTTWRTRARAHTHTHTHTFKHTYTRTRTLCWCVRFVFLVLSCALPRRIAPHTRTHARSQTRRILKGIGKAKYVVGPDGAGSHQKSFVLLE